MSILRSRVTQNYVNAQFVFYAAAIFVIGLAGLVWLLRGNSAANSFAAATGYLVPRTGRSSGSWSWSCLAPKCRSTQVVSRRMDPMGDAALTIGWLRAGSADNVIPDRAEAGGTLRVLQPHARALLLEATREVVEHTVEGPRLHRPGRGHRGGARRRERRGPGTDSPGAAAPGRA
jgi:hypothetical protein